MSLAVRVDLHPCAAATSLRNPLLGTFVASSFKLQARRRGHSLYRVLRQVDVKYTLNRFITGPCLPYLPPNRAAMAAGAFSF